MEKIGFEVIHISIKKMLHVSSKQNDARFWHIFSRVDIKFLSRMLENFIVGSTGEVNLSEMF